MKSMTEKEKQKAELKLLVAIYSREVFEGKTVRQKPPTCCFQKIDLYANAGDCEFREFRVGERVFYFIEPRCPVCGVRVRAEYMLLS